MITLLCWTFWFVVSLVFMSLIEYISHRWFMHNKWWGKTFPLLWSTFDKHTHFHHRFYRIFDKASDPVAKYINLKFDIAAHVVGALFVAFFLWWLSAIFAITFVLVVFLHAVIWNLIHGEMHEPKGAWFTNRRWYQYLRSHHKIHHEHPNKNFNVVLPGMDWLFGTYIKPRLIND